MRIPKQAYEPRPVQVQWHQTFLLLEYVPARIERPKAKQANARARKAHAKGDREAMLDASIDWLAILTGWSRERLQRQPSAWIGAALTAITNDMTLLALEFETRPPQAETRIQK